MATSIFHLLITVFLVILHFNYGIEGSPTGAPAQACSDMTPGHGFPAQTGLCPYATIPTVYFYFRNGNRRSFNYI